MKTKLKFSGRPGRRALVIGCLATVWVAVLVVGAVPAWQRALRQHQEVRQVEEQLGELDRWSVAGLWLEQSLPPREAAVTPVWNRLFPAERRREQLFLDLARVADETGVAKFELQELQADELADESPGMPAEEPAAALGGYRVRARFESDFTGVAGFLGGLDRLDRAIAVHDLEITPAKGAVQVELELDVYVATPKQS